ncbi:3-dehydroquinate synthase [Teredinibacter turnerae]|uniref:3-dehydroquinate synthase n=1 Tax=Teredinibacter turnerae TaxID=2426 RepID=UPI00037CC0F5|nr:3-dehydroquinate synthase [Teredinibacter turnerae]
MNSNVPPSNEMDDSPLYPSFSLKFSYPLCFTRNAFTAENLTFVREVKGNHKGAIPKLQFFIDQGVLDANPELANAITEYCHVHELNLVDAVHPVPGGEAAKNQIQIDAIYDLMLAAGMDRQSFIVAIGGGGVLDAVGYAASTFHRGMRLIRMPTTVLAQNDAGVGVKNGINSQGIKNLLGCFAVPHAIINDASFLDSLSARDFRSGFAEAVKVALIRDAEFFFWITQNQQALNAREPRATHHLIKRCAQLHLNQICLGGDPFEQGSARPLDYGHWSAHKLESLTKHALSHGEAVAIGMALDALYAVEIGLMNQAACDQVLAVIQGLGFNLWDDALISADAQGNSELLVGLEEFRQHLGGRLCITLLTDIGKTLEASEIDTEALLRARDKLAVQAKRENRLARVVG